MSSFEVKVRTLQILPHENADSLEIAQIDGYQAIVAKGQYKTGDLAAYIPEQAVLPEPLITEMGLTGYLAGREKNRVKAIRLRGVLSQGLVYRPKEGLPGHWDDGLEVASELGVVKYEPPVPTELMGEVLPYQMPSYADNAPGDSIFRSYDVENIKHFPDVLKPGETVFMTEKLHGTCLCLGIIGGERIITSKGLGAKGLIIKPSDTNTYWKAANEHGLFDKLQNIMTAGNWSDAMLFGEVIGVQDLMYGLEKGKTTYRAFDILTASGFLDYDVFYKLCELWDIPTVPFLYRGEFSQEKLVEYTSGKSTLANHIREGVVVRPQFERFEHGVGRVVLKSVSPEYLTRKGETTEFN